MIHLDTSQAPLIRVRCLGYIGGEELEQYIRAHNGLLDQEFEHTVLVDITDATATDSVTTRLVRIARWVGQRAGDITRNCRACAIVVDSDPFRDAVETFFNIRPLDLPIRVFSSGDAAVGWLGPFFSYIDGAGSNGRPVTTTIPPTGTSGTPSEAATLTGDKHRRWSPYVDMDDLWT